MGIRGPRKGVDARIPGLKANSADVNLSVYSRHAGIMGLPEASRSVDSQRLAANRQPRLQGFAKIHVGPDGIRLPTTCPKTQPQTCGRRCPNKPEMISAPSTAWRSQVSRCARRGAWRCFLMLIEVSRTRIRRGALPRVFKEGLLEDLSNYQLWSP